MIPFVVKVALRHLLASPVQTALLTTGVSIGVLVFVFITSLILGLKDVLVEQTIGNLSHVTLEPRERSARILLDPPTNGRDAPRILAARQPATFQRKQIRNWQSYAEIARRTPGVLVVSPQIVGNGFLVRGEAVLPASIQGVLPERLSSIADVARYIQSGEDNLDLSGIILGRKLADELGVGVGQPLVVRSDRQRERTLLVRAVYETGVGSLDERVAFVHLRVARGLFDLPDGISQIEMKVDDVFAAPEYKERLERATGLKATAWTEKNQQLRDALNAQGRSANLIQGFSLITVVVGVASALLLTTYRRRNEIGIMRSFGTSRWFIATVFLLQGGMIGFAGAIVGSVAGWQLCTFLRDAAQLESGRPLLPFDPAQGGYVLVTLLTTAGSVLAAVWPAWTATRVDPIEVITQ
jgi:lipoprotein-releasing system permease protein